MQTTPQIELVSRKYRESFGASARPDFANWLQAGPSPEARAALGYRRASEEKLFLEAYLGAPIEKVVSAALDRQFAREAIVEIGNFAATNAIAMIELWGMAANDLGGTNEVAVATLTAPLRLMFRRIGLPITILAPARPEGLGQAAALWGNYYAQEPFVCAGVIANGQAAIASFLARRNRKAAA
jgi:Thermostable hemolysin